MEGMTTEGNNSCQTHPDNPAVANCGVCNKPICRQCVQEQGYYCSKTCLEKSRGNITAEEREQRAQDAIVLQKTARTGKIVLWSMVVLILCAGIFVIWKIFLDPAGKVAWQWDREAELGTLQIIAAAPDRLLVWSGKGIFLLNTSDGSEIKSLPVDMEDVFPYAQVIDDKFLIITNNLLHLLNKDGEVTLQKKYNGTIQNFCVDQAGSLVFLAVGPGLVKELDQADENRVVAVKLQSGNEVWSKHLTAGKVISAMAVDEEKLAIVYMQPHEDFTSNVYLGIFDAADGVTSQPIKLPQSPTWGPEFGARQILLEVDKNLLAFDHDGNELWSVSGLNSFAAKRIAGDQLLIASEESFSCIDLNSAEQLWHLPISIDLHSAIIADEHLYAMGTISEKKSAELGGAPGLPPAYEEMDDVMKDMGLNMEALNTKQTRILVCVQRENGKQLWGIRNVLGDLLGDEQRLITLMDTSETSMFEMLGGGRGSTVLRQYSPKNGEKLYERQSDLGVAEPVLAGRFLCCTAFERQEKAGLLNAFGSGTSEKPRSIKTFGITAYKMK